MEAENRVCVIGAGLSGLTAAALLAGRGLEVELFETWYKAGGACGTFCREIQGQKTDFEQGVCMFYGFGPGGFAPLSYLFNCLELPLEVIKTEELFRMHYGNKDICFPEDIHVFTERLAHLFPRQKNRICRFYQDMERLYEDVIATTEAFVSPDVLPASQGLRAFCRHPISYLTFLSYMNKNVKWLLRKYFSEKELLNFFGKLTSSYCYATVEEAPAILAAVMFVDNHVGGMWYPMGGSRTIIDRLEQYIREQGGSCHYSTKITQIMHENKRVTGLVTKKGELIRTERIVYAGNIWSLYQELLSIPMPKNFEPSYTSVIWYVLVKKEVIPADMLPMEMFVEEKSRVAESEVTVYVPSLLEPALCPEGTHVLTVVSPSFRYWAIYKTAAYERQKKQEMERLVKILRKRLPGLQKGMLYSELSTPRTLERVCGKYKGACVGAKQKLGQHLLNRQHIRTKIKGLYCCGESTVMGTGAPAVVISGISATNALLKDTGRKPYGRADGRRDGIIRRERES